MAGPFGIDQVNIPALLGLHQQTKQQSLENMYRAEQIARQRRQDEQQEMRRQLIGRVFSGKAGTPPISSPTPTAPALTPAVDDDLDQYMPGVEAGTLANGQPVGTVGAGSPAIAAPETLVDPADLPARTDGISINQGALRQLYAVDPEAAMSIQKTVFDMDEATAKRIANRGSVMAQVAGSLIDVPQGMRAAAFRERVPELIALGFTPEQLNQTDLSDQGLNRYFSAGKSMEQLITARKDERDYNFKVSDAERRDANEKARIGIAGANLNLAREREGRIRKWGPQAIIVGTGAPGAPRTDTNDLDY